MPTDLPIACTLTVTELPERLAEMADLGRAALVEARSSGPRAELRFAAGTGVRDRIDSIVDAEARCCAFLTMHVTEEADTVVLAIDGPAGAELVVGELVSAFGGQPEAER